MRRMKYLIYIFLILSIAPGCEFAGISVDFGGGDSSSSSAASESVTLEAGVDSPVSGASLPMAPVEISYHASSPDGIAAVELSINGEVVSSIATPGSDQKLVALNYTWQPTVSGSHTIRVRAQSTAGGWSDYAASTVNIEGEQKEEPESVAVEKPTKTPEPTATPDEITLFDIKHDKDTFYYGNNGCGSHEMTISTRATKTEDIFQILLCMGFEDKESAGYTKLDKCFAMSKKSDDFFSITLTSEKIPEYNKFEFMVVKYQLIVVDVNDSTEVRTDVMRDINLEVCTS